MTELLAGLSIEGVVTIVALGIAIWQLMLQRREMRRNSEELRTSREVDLLLHAASTLRDEIARNEAVIQGLKARRHDYRALARKVNDEQWPLLRQVNQDVASLFVGGERQLGDAEIQTALQSVTIPARYDD